MQPYKMVEDARSSWETSNVDGVLDGGELLENIFWCVVTLDMGEGGEREGGDGIGGVEHII